MIQEHLLRPHHVLHPRQVPAQHLLVKKQQRRQRLVLRGRGDVSVRSQVFQERFDFGRARDLAAGDQVAFDLGGFEKPPDSLTITYSVLFDEDPGHRGFLLVERARLAAALDQAALSRQPMP